MRAVVVVEDQFLESYELECRLKDRGYEAFPTATRASALAAIRELYASDKLAGVITDNRLINGESAALSIYAQLRALSRDIPIAVYSAFPPLDLPTTDPRLKIVRKPFCDEAVGFVSRFGRSMRLSAEDAAGSGPIRQRTSSPAAPLERVQA